MIELRSTLQAGEPSQPMAHGQSRQIHIPLRQPVRDRWRHYDGGRHRVVVACEDSGKAHSLLVPLPLIGIQVVCLCVEGFLFVRAVFLSRTARTQRTHTHTQTPRALYRPCLSVRRVSNYSQTHTHAAITPHAISFMITRLRLVCRSPQRLLSGCSEGIAGVALGIAPPAPGRPLGTLTNSINQPIIMAAPNPEARHSHPTCPAQSARAACRIAPPLVEAYARLAAHARARARHGPSCCHERPLRHRRRRSPTRASPRCSCA